MKNIIPDDFEFLEPIKVQTQELEKLMSGFQDFHESKAWCSFIFFYNEKDDTKKGISAGVIGSGVLYRHDNKIFIITAAHVIREILMCDLAYVALCSPVAGSFRFGFKYNLHPSYLEEEKKGKSPDDNIGADVGYIEIVFSKSLNLDKNKNLAPEGTPKKKSLFDVPCCEYKDLATVIRSADLSEPIVDPSASMITRFLLVGLPSDRVLKKVQGSSLRTSAQVLCFETVGHELQDCHDKDFHIALLDNRIDATWAQSKGTEPEFKGIPNDKLFGISGCGIWGITESGQRLLAIDCSYSHRQWITGTFVGYAIALIHQFNGGLSDPDGLFWQEREYCNVINPIWLRSPRSTNGHS